MCDTQQTWEQAAVKGSDAFRSVYCPRGVECVLVTGLVPRLGLDEERA